MTKNINIPFTLFLPSLFIRTDNNCHSFFSKQTQNIIPHQFSHEYTLICFLGKFPELGEISSSHIIPIDGQFWHDSEAEIWDWNAMTAKSVCMPETETETETEPEQITWTNCQGHSGLAPAWLCAWDRLFSPSPPLSSCASTFSSTATLLSATWWQSWA